MTHNCIFCKIAKGEVPCNKIWETDDLICFLDIDPVSKGHCLVVPKEHYENLSSTPESLLSWILPKIKDTAILLSKRLGASDYNVLQNNGILAGQEVPHLHFHIIPMYKGDDAHVVCGKTTDIKSKDFKKILKQLEN